MLEYAQRPLPKPRGEGAEVAGCVIAFVVLVGGVLALVGWFCYAILKGLRRH
jgi:hypothetical protein